MLLLGLKFKLYEDNTNRYRLSFVPSVLLFVCFSNSVGYLDLVLCFVRCTIIMYCVVLVYCLLRKLPCGERFYFCTLPFKDGLQTDLFPHISALIKEQLITHFS